MRVIHRKCVYGIVSLGHMSHGLVTYTRKRENTHLKVQLKKKKKNVQVQTYNVKNNIYIYIEEIE